MWRARKNNIRKLRQDDGTWCTDQNTMKCMAINYFEQLFRKDEHINPQDIVDLLEPAVSAQANESLCNDYSDEEIGTALFQIGPLKAPGPDGLPARFFQRNWGLVKEDVIQAVKEFFFHWSYAAWGQ